MIGKIGSPEIGGQYKKRKCGFASHTFQTKNQKPNIRV
jgi:hypothetical protein